MPIYYYRRVRKMGLLELTVLLMVIGCVGQYLFGVAVYVEKKLVVVSLATAMMIYYIACMMFSSVA